MNNYRKAILLKTLLSGDLLNITTLQMPPYIKALESAIQALEEKADREDTDHETSSNSRI